MPEHVFLTAFVVDGEQRDTAQADLIKYLTEAYRRSSFTGSWWIAEDDRLDGSDNDSAVFVNPGNQAVATRLLAEVDVTGEYNLITAGRPRRVLGERS